MKRRDFLKKGTGAFALITIVPLAVLGGIKNKIPCSSISHKAKNVGYPPLPAPYLIKKFKCSLNPGADLMAELSCFNNIYHLTAEHVDKLLGDDLIVPASYLYEANGHPRDKRYKIVGISRPPKLEDGECWLKCRPYSLTTQIAKGIEGIENVYLTIL